MALFRKKVGLPQDKLSLPLEINYGQWSKIFSHLLLVVSLLVTGLIALASFAPIHEIVVAEGQIIPSGNVVETQHLDGGIVSSVSVKEGDIVQSGDVLMRVSAHDVETELRISKAQRVTLEIERTRMNALIDDESPDFDAFGAQHASVIRDQKALFEAENQAHETDLKAADLVVAQKQSELLTIHSETLKHQAEIELRKTRLGVLEGLLAKGLTTREKTLDAELGLKDSELRYDRSQGSLIVAERKVSEAQSQMANIRATQRSQWIGALSEIEKKITLLVQTMEGLNLKLNRQEILAPVSGVVQTLAAHNAGEVIKPGEVTVQLVPMTDRIEVKVNVPPEHIGHIGVGSKARIMLTAYDNETYGYANGEIAVLSPTTHRNDRGEYFYTAKLHLDRQKLTSIAGAKPILPGMVAQAEIYTGTKSLMKYLLKPVYRSVGKAFSER
ncbi:MAG: HlyD family type I secretion periplasmic adaptor subunit [Rhizobiaceae bacterium]|nr:HlyD family type I secretion periplasmic adaptor subunit [Rhizobiaceae bacterium]